MFFMITDTNPEQVYSNNHVCKYVNVCKYSHLKANVQHMLTFLLQWSVTLSCGLTEGPGFLIRFCEIDLKHRNIVFS